MSEMIERVAKTLHKAHYERGRRIAPPWELIEKWDQEMWRISARAAIEAMREPTAEMIKVGSFIVAGVDDEETMGETAEGAFRAMIGEEMK